MGHAVGQYVVALAGPLVAGGAEIADRHQDALLVARHRASQRPAVRVDDGRAADPVHAALVADAVAGRDEHPVDRRGRLRPDDLHRPLAVRPGEQRPVRRGAQQLRPGQSGQPDPLGELQVVADHHGQPGPADRHHRRRLRTGREHQLLGVPEVDFPIGGEDARASHDDSGVVQGAVIAELADAADQRDAEAAGQGHPLRGGRAVHRLGQRARFGQVPEDIAAAGQFGQDDDARALAGRPRRHVQAGRPVRRQLAHPGRNLTAGHGHPRRRRLDHATPL